MTKINLQPSTDESKHFLRMYDEAMENTIVTSRADPSRMLSLRCSQLPFCGPAFFTNLVNNGMFRHLDVRGMYYTSVGTTVHEVMQKAMSIDNEVILGDWKCVECGKVSKFTTVKTCCGFPMDYEEISVNYKGIQGHMDTVYIAKSGLWIVDYKTTSLKARSSKSKDPGPAYKEQLLSYATLVERQHGEALKKAGYPHTVTGIMNLFIPRDDPAQRIVWSQALTTEMKDAQWAKIRTYKKYHKLALNLTTKKEVLKLLEQGKCGDQYCQVCNNRSYTPKQLVLNAYKQVKRKGNLPLLKYVTDNTK